MGARGPVPKRSEERVGHPMQAGGHAADITPGELREVKWPPADSSWSKRAKEMYASVRDNRSGQADFFQQSDVARLRFMLDQMTYYESQPQRSAMMLQVLTSEMSNLLFSEGDRRRVRIELSRVDNSVKNAEIVAIDSYREDLGL